MRNERRAMKTEGGMALVLTLLILVLITALITEFSYGVFTTTSALYNWRDSQRLSFVAKSGTSLAVKTVSDLQSRNLLYKFPGKMDVPVENMLEGFGGNVTVVVEDENSRFNLNSLRRDVALGYFKKLLENLHLKEEIADRIRDWIDVDSDPQAGLRDSEDGAKNAYMDSVDELLVIKGIDYETYEKLRPYVTVYGYQADDDLHVNINTAEIPVIMCFNITRELAEKIVSLRPFQNLTELNNAGFDRDLWNAVSGNFALEPAKYHMTVIAEENKIKRVIESVVSGQQIKYWKEM